MSDSSIRVGVVGFGNSAKAFHLPFITTQSEYQLVAISSSQLEAVATAYPQAVCYASAETLIKEADVDLVIITAPNHVHFSLTKLALENGKHVVLEKPMANTSEEAEQLVRIAEKENRLFSIYQNRRWDGDFLTVKKLLNDNKLGKIKHFESHFDRFRPIVETRWREEAGLGNGIWFDLGPHLVDQTIQLFGLPEAVTARILTMRENAKTADYAHVTLHYDNLEAVMHMTTLSAIPNQRFRIDGSKGSYLKAGLDVQEGQLKSGILPTNDSFAKESQDCFGSLFTQDAEQSIVTQDGQYAQYYRLMSKAILNQGPVPVPPREIINVIKVIELGYQSQAEGKTLKFNGV